LSKKQKRTDNSETKKTEGNKNLIIKLAVTAIVSIIVGGLIGPYASSYFSSVFSPKPNIHFVEEDCAIIPIMPENVVFIKAVIKNIGSTSETNIKVRFSVDYPWSFGNSSWIEHKFELIPANQA
jgi:hypothetical protein